MIRAALFTLHAIAMTQAPHSGSQGRGFLAEEFAEIKRVEEIPPKVREILGSSKSEFGNPDGPFNAGCIDQPGVPFRRMLFAGSSSRFVIVAYEQGGRAHFRYLKVFEISNGGARVIKGGSLSKAYSSLHLALESIRNGSLQLQAEQR